jgi:predicted metal-dependent hydrolase
MSRDFPLPISLRRSARAKHVRLVVKAGGAELVLPSGVSEAQGLAFLERHRAWAERKIQEIQERLKSPLTPEVEEWPGAVHTVPFQGRTVPFLVRQNPNPGTRVRIVRQAEGPFEITLPCSTTMPSSQLIRSALFAWVKQWMRAEAHSLAVRHGEAQRLLPRDIRVKRMTSRWGSCGPRNDINLNWLLAFTPPTVLEYVVVHEICHIRHRNHSPEYWDLVSSLMPDWPAQRLWLKNHGGELMRRFA